VLLWGGAEVVTPKLASSDLQFLANRKFSCTEICAAFGVPEEIITTTNELIPWQEALENILAWHGL
jgi:hypothetical protein